MSKRFVTIWFPYLKTDWFCHHRPGLNNIPFVLASPDHGRMIITSANNVAQLHGINVGMTVADARVIIPCLHVIDDKPDLSCKLLTRIAEWCIRFTPFVCVDLPDSLILDVTGC